MLFRVMVGGSDYCHKNIKSNMTTVVHSQMHSYSTSFIKTYGTKEKVTEKKYQRQKKVSYKKKTMKRAEDGVERKSTSKYF